MVSRRSKLRRDRNDPPSTSLAWVSGTKSSVPFTGSDLAARRSATAACSAGRTAGSWLAAARSEPRNSSTASAPVACQLPKLRSSSGMISASVVSPTTKIVASSGRSQASWKPVRSAGELRDRRRIAAAGERNAVGMILAVDDRRQGPQRQADRLLGFFGDRRELLAADPARRRPERRPGGGRCRP